jgi:hypothetical protein
MPEEIRSSEGVGRSRKADRERVTGPFDPCSNASAHKFTRANCFNGLSALLRIFFRSFGLAWSLVLRRREAASKACLEFPEGIAPEGQSDGTPWSHSDGSSNLRPAIRGTLRIAPSPILFWAPTRPKTAKTKRSGSRKGRKSLRSLMAPNQRFRGIVYFQ